MRFSQEIDQHHFYIHAIETNSVEIAVPNPRAYEVVNIDGHVVTSRSFVISPRSLQMDWEVSKTQALTQQIINSLGDLTTFEVLIIGTGDSVFFPKAEILKPIIELGIGYEIMKSDAACRTYNILCGEGRQVMAAIML